MSYKSYLREYQQKILEHTLSLTEQNYRAFYNAGDVGVGKTPTTIYTINELAKPSYHILCVTNGSTRTNWGREIFKHSSTPNTLEVYSAKDISLLTPQHSWVVISYALLNKPKTLKKLLDWKFDILLCDESQALTNYKSKRTQICLALGALSKFMFWLSATPVRKSLSDMYPFLRFSKPNEVQEYYAYLDKFCIKQSSYYGSGITYSKGKNFPEFRELIKPLFIRTKKEDVIDEMPALTYDKILLKGNKKILKEINEERETKKFKTFINSMGETERKPIPHNLADFRRRSYMAKHEDCKEFVENLLNQDIPVIVAYFFHETLDFIMEEYKNWSPRCIKGSTPSKKRQQYVDEFNNGEKLLLVGQIKSIGVGLNIHHTCSTVVVCETSYEPDDLSQLAGRVHRYGQTKPCTMYVLTLQDSIDEDIVDILMSKTRLIIKAIDHRRDEE